MIIAEGCYLDGCTLDGSVIGIQTQIEGGTSVRRSVLLGADLYEADDEAPPRGDARDWELAGTSCSIALLTPL